MGLYYRQLLVWQRGVELVQDVYAVSALLPADERYGLTQQLKRAVVSVPANVAEGAARDHTKEFMNFLSIARGSLAEVETYLEIIHQMNWSDPQLIGQAFARAEEVGKMLSSLQASIRNKQSHNPH